MSVNKYDNHVLLLPEDDAIRQIANGFLLDVSMRTNRVQVLTPAGGWLRVLEDFKSVHAPKMARFPHRHVVLLIDLDDQQDRLEDVRGQIPLERADRVFVLGIASESEDLKAKLGLSFEKIGELLAKDCRSDTDDFWSSALLKVNMPEIRRLREHVSPILFGPD